MVSLDDATPFGIAISFRECISRRVSRCQARRAAARSMITGVHPIWCSRNAVAMPLIPGPTIRVRRPSSDAPPNPYSRQIKMRILIPIISAGHCLFKTHDVATVL
jgi:hypothetical protein